MSVLDELVEFLLACIADDEAAERRKWRRLKDDERTPASRGAQAGDLGAAAKNSILVLHTSPKCCTLRP